MIPRCKHGELLLILIMAVSFFGGILTSNGTPLHQTTDSRGTLAQSAAPMKIMTTTTVPWDIVRNIGGDLVDVQPIVSGATDIHTFQGPTVTQVDQLLHANVTFCMGNSSAGLTDLEPWLPAVNASLGGIHIVPLIQPAMIKPDPAIDNADNPHVWLDPDNVKIMANTVTSELINHDPANAVAYRANNASYQGELDSLLARIQTAKNNTFNGLKVVSRHPSFTYLFWLLGINQRAVIEHVEGQEPTQNWINDVIQLMKNENIETFVGQPQLNQDEINSVARDAGARVAWLTDAPGITLDNGTRIGSYIAMMDYNMYALAHPVAPPAQSLDVFLIVALLAIATAVPLVLIAFASKKRVSLPTPRHFHKHMEATAILGKQPIIDLEHVSLILGNNTVLNDISLKISKGEYVGLIGKNGSGKSTLVKTILGIYKPTKGTVQVFGEHVHGRIYERIGYTAQMHGITREFPATAGDVVAMGLYKKKGMISRLTKDDLGRVALALHKVNMEEYINRPIGHLSGGEQQKVLIAQALVRDPEILLLDEPTSALDYMVIKDILALLTELNKIYGITLIVIQHNLELLLPFCTRLVMLRRSIVFDGKPDAPGVKDALRITFDQTTIGGDRPAAGALP